MSSSSFLTQAQRAALHRETYTAVIKGLLGWGGGRRLALERLGITPVYLSNLLDPLHNPPSPALAHRIVAALPLESDQRLSLLEHMLLARENQTALRDSLHPRRRGAPPAVLYAELRAAYDHTLLTNASAPSLTPLTLVREAGKALLRWMDPGDDPLLYVEACLIVHNAECALNGWTAALYQVRLALAVLQQLNESWWMRHDPRFGHLLVNTLYAESLTYRNLGLPRWSLRSLAEAARVLRRLGSEVQDFWLPNLYRDHIESLGLLPRFALSEVEGLARRTQALQDALGSDPVQRMLIARAQINAYTRYGSSRSLAQAERLVAFWLERFGHDPTIGPLQQVMFLRTAVGLFAQQADHEALKHHARRALELAAAHGLRHQQSALVREYGVAACG